MTWYRQDAFLHPDNAEFDPTQPGNIGGIKPKPFKMFEVPDPAVREFEGVDETDVERHETADKDDAVNPTATDDEMFSPVSNANFRASGKESLEDAFAEPKDRAPGVVNEDDDDA